MTPPPTPLMTAEDLLNLSNDGYRYELVDGVLIHTSQPGFAHSILVAALIHVLRSFAIERTLGVVGGGGGFVFRRKPDRVYAPDVVFVRAHRLPPRDQREGFLDLIPDFAAEVLSPSDTVSQVNAKMGVYLEAGVRRAWVVDPRRQGVTVWEPNRTARVFAEGDALDGGDVLPGFRLPVADLFR